MKFLKTGRHFHRLDVSFPEALDNRQTGVGFVVLGHFLRRQLADDRNGSVKMIGVGRSLAGQFHPSLRKHSGMSRMGMSDAADFLKLPIQNQVSRRVG